MISKKQKSEFKKDKSKYWQPISKKQQEKINGGRGWPYTRPNPGSGC